VKNAEVTVAAVVMREGRLLLVEERIGGRLLLNQPAGHLESGETVLDAVIREAREETAWRFAPQALVGTYLWRGPDGRGFLRFAFCGEVDDLRAHQPLDTGIVRTLWLTPTELGAQAVRHRSPLVMRCVEDFLRGQRQTLDAVACLDLESARHVPTVVNL